MAKKRPPTLKRQIEKLESAIALQRGVLKAIQSLGLADGGFSEAACGQIIAQLQGAQKIAQRRLEQEEFAAEAKALIRDYPKRIITRES